DNAYGIYFFFQEEDGIRDRNVTGVQTCALPIYDWNEVFPEEILNMNMQDGKIYGLPMNVHRNNVIWYDKEIFDDLNLDIPTNFDEFIEVSEKIDAEGITPIALGDKNPRWTTLWFDAFLLDELGADDYAKAWEGELDLNSPEFKNAAEKLKTTLGFINDNHSSLDWQDAAD